MSVAVIPKPPAPSEPPYGESPLWIDAVPTGWVTRRLKTVLVRNDGGVWGDDFDSEGTIVLRSTEQTVGGEWQIGDPARRSLSATDRAAAMLRAGDLVLTKSSGSALHIGKTSIVTPEVAALRCCFSNFMQRLRCDLLTEPRFVFYILNSTLGREQMAYGSNSSTGLANLSGSIVGSIQAAFPPLPKQRAIAAWLDDRTKRIDELVAAKRRLIALLAEQRTALITKAVTKGLNPEAPMKPSGIDWIGDVPGEVRRLKFLSSFVTSGSRGWAEYYSDEGDVFLRIGNVSRVAIDLDLSDVQRVTPPTGAEGERTVVHGEDVLISVTAYIGAVGIVPDEFEKAYVNQHLALVRPRREHVVPRYLAYAMFSALGQVQFRQLMYGGTKEGLSLEDVKNLQVIVPSLIEQRAIVAHLDAACERFARLIRAAENAIARLDEYRQSLITAAVTGKIDVRKGATA